MGGGRVVATGMGVTGRVVVVTGRMEVATDKVAEGRVEEVSRRVGTTGRAARTSCPGTETGMWHSSRCSVHTSRATGPCRTCMLWLILSRCLVCFGGTLDQEYCPNYLSPQ